MPFAYDNAKAHLALRSYAFINIPSRYSQMLSVFWFSLSIISLNVIKFGALRAFGLAPSVRGMPQNAC